MLLTGATGTLGTPTTAKLKEAGYEVRALSRTHATGLTAGNLLTGEGIPEAMTGVDTLVHLATGKRDVNQAKVAIDAAKTADIGHLVLISIVGIDGIPLGYYKGKLQIEKYLVESGVPFTILRATQFYQFIDGIFSSQKYLPAIIAPKFGFQPISTDEVAVRLTELVTSGPAGRVADIGGPSQFSSLELAQKWKNVRHLRRPIWTVSLPGKTAKGFAAGHNLVPGEPYGVKTFDEYLEAKYAS